MALRTCSVTFTDSRGIRHTADVSAESLFEAVVLGVRALRENGWTDPIGVATKLEVEIREPVTKHTVTLRQVERWLSGTPVSPKE